MEDMEPAAVGRGQGRMEGDRMVATTAAQTTLCERLGGETAVGGAVDEFDRRVLADPGLDGIFSRLDLVQLKRRQRLFFGHALLGPARCNGHALREARAGLGVDDGDFERVAGHLTDTLAWLGIPHTLATALVARVAGLRRNVAALQALA